MKNLNSCNYAVFLFGRKNLPSRLLMQFISNTLSIECQIISSNEKIFESSRHSESLIIFDCSSNSSKNIERILSYRHKNGVKTNCALINAPYENCYEDLLIWPMLRGIIYENYSEDLLEKALKHLYDKGHWLPRHLTEKLLRDREISLHEFNRIDMGDLTKREKQVLLMVGEAATNNEIASRLNLSSCTIKTHLTHIYKKIQVRNRVEASCWINQHLH